MTDRLLVAAAFSIAGALLAVLAGLPEAALFVVPWVVLLVLGLNQDEDVDVRVDVRVSNDRLLVGDDVQVTTTIGASADVTVTVVPHPSEAFWPASLADVGRSTARPTVDAVRANTAIEVVTTLSAHEWGAHDLGSVAVHVSPAYGLFELEGATAERRMVRVHPTPSQIRELLTPWMVRRVTGTHRSRESARGIEYADIREFAAGDSVRDINWRVSARSQELWVSQRHPDRATDVVLLVDSFVESGHDIRTVFGLVVEAAVALAESHLAATDRVGLIEFGGVVRWVSPSTGSVQLQRLTDALLATGLYANAADKALPILPPRALPPRSFVIAFTPLLDERFIEAVFTARARGHDVAVVECVVEPEETEQELSASGQLTQRIYEAERAMMRDNMAEQGIAVTQWSGVEHLDVALGELLRRRRRSVRVVTR